MKKLPGLQISPMARGPLVLTYSGGTKTCLEKIAIFIANIKK